MNRFVVFALISLCIVGRPIFGQESLQEPSSGSVEPTPVPESTPEARTKTKSKAPPEESGPRDIQDSMTAGEFKAAGLDKLSAEELHHLNAWLQGERTNVATKAAAKATEEVKKTTAGEVRSKMDSLLSRVDGTFTGLTGHTIIKLEDGTTWKQANADDRLRATVTDHPPVKVMHSTFGYKMRVVGTGEFYVDPVR